MTDGRARAARHTHGQEKEEISIEHPARHPRACGRGKTLETPVISWMLRPRFGFGSVVGAAGACEHVPVGVRLRQPVLASVVPLAPT